MIYQMLMVTLMLRLILLALLTLAQVLISQIQNDEEAVKKLSRPGPL